MSFYPRETTEFIPVTVTIDGAVVTSGVQFSVTTNGARPTVWIAPIALDGKIGVMTILQEPEHYRIWAKITDSPEIPVIDCGYYTVT